MLEITFYSADQNISNKYFMAQMQVSKMCKIFWSSDASFENVQNILIFLVIQIQAKENAWCVSEPHLTSARGTNNSIVLDCR